MVFKMKKIIISLILVVMLFSSIGVLSACKDNAYQLSNMANDFKSTTANLNYININDNHQISIDYQGGNENNNYLNSTVSNIYPYKVLKSYETVLKNELIFVEKYIEICGNNDLKASKDERNQIKSNINSFGESLGELNFALENLNSTIKVYYFENTQTNIACLAKFKTVLYAYEKVFKSAEDFSDNLIKIYLNYANTNSNKNVLDLNQFNAADVISNLDSKLYFEIANLSKVFVEKYVNGQTNIEKCGNGDASVFVNGFASYNSKTRVLNTSYNTEQSTTRVSGEKKSEFHALAVENYNAFNLVSGKLNSFKSASNQTDYSSVRDDSSAKEKADKAVIDDFSNLLDDYQVTLKNMLTMMRGE